MLQSPKSHNERKIGVLIEDISEPHPLNRKKPSLAKLRPDLAHQWLYKKNCGFGPEDFSCGSGILVWWQCTDNKKHVWQASIIHRTSRGDGCPYCSGRGISETNSLAHLFPEIAEDWHPKKNCSVKPSDVTAFSQRNVWWQCKKGHEWRTSISNRTGLGSGCGRCSKNMLDLTEYPEAMKYFDKVKNKGLDPSQVTMHIKIHWRCKKGEDHQWYQVFTKRCSPDRFCPYCSNRKVSKTNSLKTLNPTLAKEFHKTKNGKLTPDTVMAGSGRLIYWTCRKCQHTWKAQVSLRTGYNSGCPRCWIKNRPNVLKKVAARRKLDRLQN